MTNYKPKITIKIFDTLKNSLQELKTNEPDILKMYVCGPTVYDRPHLGNARSIVVYDLFYRFFKEVFNDVIFVRNITDVDDKINASAKEKNISIQNLTSQIIQYFYDDISALNVLRPTF
ncbi:MAG: class I tRNA ligase family protein, partial [Alphaproteobacteria bacterium]